MGCGASGTHPVGFARKFRVEGEPGSLVGVPMREADVTGADHERNV